MEFVISVIGLLVAVFTVYVALRQLRLQSEEVKRNSKVNALIHVATLVKEKIELHEQIIADQKRQNKPEWTSHARRVNDEMRPLLASVNGALIQLISTDAEGIDITAIRQLLKLPPT